MGQRRDPYVEERDLGTGMHDNMGVISFWYPHVMYFQHFFFDMDVPYFKGRHPYKILSQHEWHKKGKYIEALLER